MVETGNTQASYATTSKEGMPAQCATENSERIRGGVKDLIVGGARVVKTHFNEFLIKSTKNNFLERDRCCQKGS